MLRRKPKFKDPLRTKIYWYHLYNAFLVTNIYRQPVADIKKEACEYADDATYLAERFGYPEGF